MIYRIKQAIWAISSNFKEIDYTYINKYIFLIKENMRGDNDE